MRADALTAYWPGWHTAWLQVQASWCHVLTFESVRGLFGSIGVEWITSCPMTDLGHGSEQRISAVN